MTEEFIGTNPTNPLSQIGMKLVKVQKVTLRLKHLLLSVAYFITCSFFVSIFCA